MEKEKELWHIKVRQTQVFNQNSTSPGSTRDFDYDAFIDTQKEEDARKAAEARLLWTAEKFADVYWEDGCPPATYFDLECAILSANRTTFEKSGLARTGRLIDRGLVNGRQYYSFREHQ